jgi:hypothetical protein
MPSIAYKPLAFSSRVSNSVNALSRRVRAMSYAACSIAKRDSLIKRIRLIGSFLLYAFLALLVLGITLNCATLKTLAKCVLGDFVRL